MVCNVHQETLQQQLFEQGGLCTKAGGAVLAQTMLRCLMLLLQTPGSLPIPQEHELHLVLLDETCKVGSNTLVCILERAHVRAIGRRSQEGHQLLHVAELMLRLCSMLPLAQLLGSKRTTLIRTCKQGDLLTLYWRSPPGVSSTLPLPVSALCSWLPGEASCPKRSRMSAGDAAAGRTDSRWSSTSCMQP